MKSPARWRQIWLFLAAMVLPSVVLLALGAWMIAEGQEIATARQSRELGQLKSTIVQRLTATLERIKLERTSAFSAEPLPTTKPADGSVAVVAELRDGQLLLPWDLDSLPAQARRALESATYGQWITQGERQELNADSGRAVTAYRNARTAATTAFEIDYASLLLARFYLFSCICAEDAMPLYVSLLKSTSLDDAGMPLALYAAKQLVGLSVEENAVLDLLDNQITGAEPVGPAAMYLQREVLQTLASRAGDARARASDLLAKLEPQLEDVEQALALKRDITRVVPATTGSAAADDWILFGHQPWLVGVARVSGRTPVVVAVRARVLLPDIAREMSALPSAGATVEFVTDGSTGEAVDRAFPGLRVNLAINEDATASGWRLQRTYYIVALLIVVAVTASGGYSLWRNLRREMRLAELRSQFVSSVSHELRTPLTAIRMFAETLQLERPLDSPTKAEYLGTIVNESERLTRLLNNVLDFSKIERGERVYRLEEAALDAVVRQAAGAMQYPLTRLGFALHVDVPDEMPPVRIDRDAIEQAVLNLLNNAMKYSRDCRDIALRLHAARGDAVIEVTDRGLGIAAADHQRIFERFYRAPVPENRLIPGTGLGLALVDHIVKGHGGRVEVRSAPGAGSTFAIHLPLAV